MEEKELNPETMSENTAPQEEMATENVASEPINEVSEIDQVKADLAEQKDKYLRLMADFENFKKVKAKERIELIQTANKDVLVSLLDILDDCDRAEKQLSSAEDIALQKEGVQLVFNKIRSTLQTKGLKVMESVGKDFDVDSHEAIAEIPAPDDALKGKVVDEIMKGYLLNDKIIRFAKVVVGK